MIVRTLQPAGRTAGAGAPVSPSRRPGMSLLEVLLAMTVFLLALVAIGRLVDVGTDNAVSSHDQSMGTRLAQSKLAEAEAGVIDLAAGASGTFDNEPTWNYAVEPAAADVPNVYAVTVRVWRESGGRRHEVSLTQMIFDPHQSGTAAEAQPPAAAAPTGATGTESGTATTGGTP